MHVISDGAMMGRDIGVAATLNHVGVEAVRFFSCGGRGANTGVFGQSAELPAHGPGGRGGG